MVRIKNRFIVGQILLPFQGWDTKFLISTRDLQKSIRDKVTELFGVVGAGDFQNTIVNFLDAENSLIFVIRTSRDAEIYVRYAISCITVLREKGNIVLRSLCVNSCPRTCASTLKELLKSYYLTKLDDKDGKNVAIEAVEKLLEGTDL
jgi:RNase P/RNase MRP subunit POP5